MSKVNHQYIIRVHSILQRKQKYFIFMQYGENGDLLEFIRTHGPVRERQAKIWFAQILKGLKYLHDRDIAHRDMKCENLLLTAAYNIKIADFGFARYTVDESGKQILSETFCGSVSYASPEIIRGQPYDCKLADLWSVGIILYIVLNKAMPFDDSSLKKLYEAQMTRSWKVRSKLKDVLSQHVKEYMGTLLEPDPTKRKSLETLWEDPWLQSSSNAEIVTTVGPLVMKRGAFSTEKVQDEPPAVTVGINATRLDKSQHLLTGSGSREKYDDMDADRSASAPPIALSVHLGNSKDELVRAKSKAELQQKNMFELETKSNVPGNSVGSMLDGRASGSKENIASRKDISVESPRSNVKLEPVAARRESVYSEAQRN